MPAMRKRPPLAWLAGILASQAIQAQELPREELIEKGADLARAADCVTCHTAPDGERFAGGRPVETPVGTIYSTNITPDPETGIGRYTLEDFTRAVREGKGRDGHRLYPAMPYPSYAEMSDEEIHALYIYFQHGVEPVSQENRDSEIPWPLSMRWPLVLWDWLFGPDDTGLESSAEPGDQ